MNQQIATYVRHKRRRNLLRLVYRLGGPALLLRLASWFYHLRIEGWERLPAQGACILAFQHTSMASDALFYLAARQRRPDLRVFALSMTAGTIGDLLTALSGEADGPQLILAYKRGGLSAGPLLSGYRHLLAGGALALAPEGELSWDGRLQQPLLPGAAWLALRTGAPLIPVGVCGGYDIQPVWQMDRLALSGRITIRLGEALYFPAMDSEVPAQALADANQRLLEAMQTVSAG